MPSFSDSAVIFLLALLLFGPKKLPELARYLGKMMGEFRRASAEFRMQMEDEFRVLEQAEQQKKIAAIEAAAPVTPLDIPEPEHPHMPAPLAADADAASPSASENATPEEASGETTATPPVEPVPIASSGDLHMRPPATGLPIGRSNGNGSHPSAASVAAVFEAIPHTADPSQHPVPVTALAEPEAQSG